MGLSSRSADSAVEMVVSFGYKILAIGARFYVLQRGVRENDFRASGSGKFTWVREIQSGLLDFCRAVQTAFNIPHLSLDVVESKGSFYLIEFQAVYFGSLTLDLSDCYFAQTERGWVRVEEKSVFEEEYARSMADYINSLAQ